MKLLFLFLWYTGCRPSELINLKWLDIDYDKEVLIFRCGKNSHITREFPINDEVSKILHQVSFKVERVFMPFGKILKK